ncbi:MAG TPA: hypothetical protein EYP80_02060, partial [Candidatus Aenigmarchaeota archaeon]|nr:hypothetical protein [Candidatus Aenigmarchaeota archaeon]
MGILEFIKKHYHRCNKKFLYLGAGLIVISLMLLTTFWGIYTTSSTEIRLEENTFTYQGMSPGESLRVHGKITEIEYYGGVVPDIPNMRDYPTCSINMSSDSYLEEKQILDNVSEKEKRFSNMTFSNKLIYGGVFSYVFFDNISFDHVDFIHTTFSHAVFMNVVFTNSTFLDCRFSQLEFHAVSFSSGYLR